MLTDDGGVPSYKLPRSLRLEGAKTDIVLANRAVQILVGVLFLLIAAFVTSPIIMKFQSITFDLDFDMDDIMILYNFIHLYSPNHAHEIKNSILIIEQIENWIITAVSIIY